jgi:hypothetical protein
MIIADTPGSEDTQGAEIEYANVLGIRNAFSEAKFLKIALIFSYKNMGDRS